MNNESAAAVEVAQEGNVQSLSGSAPARKLSKVDMKRAMAHQERRKRLINKGVAPDKVDQAIAEEDYQALPTEQKLKRVVAYFSQIIQGMAQDINALNHNSNAIIDTMEVRNKAYEKGLEKLGLTEEDRKKFLADAEIEVRAEFEKRQADLRKKEEDKQKAIEKAKEDAAVKALNQAEGKPEASTAAPAAPSIPEGATTFGD